MKHQALNVLEALKVLEEIERKAWNANASGSEADRCCVFGQEGKLYKAWCKAVDDCRDYRKAHSLLDIRDHLKPTLKEIENGCSRSWK